MSANLFTGSLVRLTAEEPDVFARAFSRWGRDSEYIRLLDNDALHLWSAKKQQEWLEKDMDKYPPEEYFFQIRTLEGDDHIGFVGLWGLSFIQGDAWVGIGLGERNYWGKGYGTDAMCLTLGYAFDELNLRRVSLGVFEYNQRGIGSYEKAGFQIEGRLRKAIARDRQRWDIVTMGVMRGEWEARRNNAP